MLPLTLGGFFQMKQPVKDKKHSFLFRFVTSYSVLLLLVLILGFYFSYSSLNQTTGNLFHRNLTLLENSIEDLDTSFQLLSTLTTQVTSNVTVRQLLYHDALSPQYYTLAKDTMTYLATLLSLQAILPISDFYIYLPNTDYLISTNTFESADLFYHYAKNGSDAQYELWRATLTSYYNMKTLLPLRSYFGNTSSFLYKIQLSNYNSRTIKPSIACFEIRPSDLKAVFINLFSSPSSYLLVTDSAGTVLFSLSNDDSHSMAVEHVRQGQPSRYSTDVSEFLYEGERYFSIEAVSSYNGWHYYLVQPSSYLLGDLYTYLRTYILAIGIACIAAFLLIYMLSKANVKPILAINDRLASSELKATTLLDVNESLRNSLETQRPLVYSTYMARIMKGYSFTEEEVSEIADFFHLNLASGNSYFVLYAGVYLEQLEFYREVEDSPSASSQALEGYEAVIFQCFYKYFGDDILIYHPDVNSFALLLCAKEPVATETLRFQETAQQTFLELHNELSEQHSLWIFGGIGDGNTKLPYFWKSYQQAMEAAAYLSEGSVFQIYHNIRRSNEAYYYPFEMAGQLTNFIQANNGTQIQEIFKLIRRENFEFRSLSLQTVKWLFSDIRNTLAKVRYSIPETADNQERLAQIDQLFLQNKSLELLEKISFSLAALFKPKQDTNKLIAAIREYICENFSDADLSLKKISDTFHISESYFSYLFKAETNQNFSEYLEEIRMQEAMRLVKETTLPLSELYLSLGYNNPNSFRRAFKKVHGVSPKVIRDASSDAGSDAPSGSL